MALRWPGEGEVLWPGVGGEPDETDDTVIGLDDLAVALRLGTGSAPVGAVGTELERLRAVAVALVNDVSTIASCPASVKNQCVVQLVGWWFAGPLADRSDPAALRRSGALGLLRTYVQRGASSLA